MCAPRIVPLLAAALLLAAPPRPAAAQPSPPAAAADGTPRDRACGAPAELVEEAALPLPAAARAVQDGRIRILVVGSASVFGPGTTDPTQAWPARLEALLARRFPGLAVELTIRGGRGLTAADTAGLLAAELPRLHPHLVLWQTGTVDAVRGLEPDLLTDALNATMARVAAAGADLMLMDPQFSRFLRANTNIEPYREAILLAAAAHGVPVLRRYDLMRVWAETDRVDLERAPREQRGLVADRLNACLAEAAAAMIGRGVAEARGSVSSARP